MKIETKKKIVDWLMARPKMAMAFMVTTAPFCAVVMGKRVCTDVREFCKYMRGVEQK